MAEVALTENTIKGTQRLRTYSKKFRTLLDALIILAGIFLSKALQDNALLFAYLLVAVLIGAITLRVSRRASGKKGPVVTVRVIIGEVIEWLLRWSEEFTMAAGVAILLAAGLVNWGGWVLFAVFFGLALEMIYVEGLIKSNKIDTRISEETHVSVAQKLGPTESK